MSSDESAGGRAEPKPTPAGEQVDDNELDELMNSAFADMYNQQARKRGNSIGGSSIKPAADGVDWNPSENVWSEEFLQNAAATFESNMATLLGTLKGSSDNSSITQDQVADTFKMMAEAAAHVMKPAEDSKSDKGKLKSSNDVSAAIAKTLENLNTNSDDLQKAASDDELAKMFSGLGVGQEGAPDMFVPFMQNMMQSLLSKDVLFPSLKAMVEKYPTWLQQNKSKLDPKEYERFSKQNTLMSKVCAELEKERETDSEEIKKKRFDVILVLMQEMQELGQPPSELTEETSFGEQNLEGISLNDPNQCRPM